MSPAPSAATTVSTAVLLALFSSMENAWLATEGWSFTFTTKSAVSV